MKAQYLLLLSLLASGAARASEAIVLEETEANIEAVVDMKTYYSGAVNLFSLDHEEPAARPMEIVLVVPNGDGGGGFIDRKTLSAGSFCSANLTKIVSKYDEKNGLTLSIPVSHYTGFDCSDNDTLVLNIKMTKDSNSVVTAKLKNRSGN